jgi:hypothetical protein
MIALSRRSRPSASLRQRGTFFLLYIAVLSFSIVCGFSVPTRKNRTQEDAHVPCCRRQKRGVVMQNNATA